MENVGTIGTIATSIAAIVAVTQLLRAIRIYRLEQTKSEAAQKRETLNEISSNVHRIVLSVKDDIPTLSGASGIIKELNERLGSKPSRKEFWASFRDPTFLHSIFVTGWESTPEVLSLREEINHLQRLSEQIKGLPVLLTGVDLILLIHRFAYSSTPISKRILSREVMDGAMEPVEGFRSVNYLMRHLNMHIVGQIFLAGGTAKDALTLSAEYISEVNESLSKLSDKALIEIFNRRGQSNSYFGLEYQEAVELAIGKAEQEIQEEKAIETGKKALLTNHLQEIRRYTSPEHILSKIQDFQIKSSAPKYDFFMPSISETTPDTKQDTENADRF